MRINKKLIKGSFILMIVVNIYALLNFIYQAAMARFLSLADYSILAALFYLVYLLNVFGESIQVVLAKHAAKERNDGKIKNILKRAIKKLGKITVLFFIIYSIIVIPLFFLKQIPYLLLIINGFFIFTIFFLSVNRGIMQGKERFFSLGKNLIIEASFKLAIAIFLVLIGWKVYGAIIGAVIGTFVALIFSFFSLKDIILAEEKIADSVELKISSKKTFILNFSLFSFYVVDILIAQIVFSKELAGAYSIAAVLSKAIFWGTNPIGKAMFPISVEESNKDKKESRNTYYNALIILSFFIAIALLLFYFFPMEIVKIFSGKEIVSSAQILFYLGLATSALAIANLNILYKISSNEQTKKIYLFYFFLVLGIVLLFIFNKNLIEYSLAFLTVSTMYLWGSTIL